MSELVYLPESRPNPPEVAEVVSVVTAQVRSAHMAFQEQKPPEKRDDVDADTWLLLHQNVCSTLSLSDSELWALASEYDEGVLPEDKLGVEERRYWGSLLDRNVQYFMIYSKAPKTAERAEAMAADELRKEVAARMTRLAYMSQLSPAEYAMQWRNNKVLIVGALAASIADAAWQRLQTRSTEEAAGAR